MTTRLEASATHILQGCGKEFWGFTPEFFANEVRRRMIALESHFTLPEFDAPATEFDLLRKSSGLSSTRLPSRIVGLHGAIGSGKDETALALCEQSEFERFAFGDNLRLALVALYQIPLDEFMDRDKKEAFHTGIGASPRTLARLFGTEVCRDIRQDVWVRSLELSMRKRQCERAVIADVRFEDEAQFLRETPGGCVVHVIRPGNPHAQHMSTHASDQGLARQPADIVLMNDGTLEDLRARVVEKLAAPAAPAAVRRAGI